MANTHQRRPPKGCTKADGLTRPAATTLVHFRVAHQQRLKRAESRRFGAPGSVRMNAAEMPPPPTLPENVPVAPRANAKFNTICEPDIVPLADPELGPPSGLRPVTDALTLVPLCCSDICQLLPLAHVPQ